MKVTIKQERFKTEQGLGFGVYQILVDGKKIYQKKPRLTGKPQFTGGTDVIKSKKQALEFIDRFGEIRADKRFQNKLLSLFEKGEKKLWKF